MELILALMFCVMRVRMPGATTYSFLLENCTVMRKQH